MAKLITRDALEGLLECIGLAAIVYGAWLAWHPLGWIVGGVGIIVGVVFTELGHEKKGEEAEPNE